MAVQQRKVSKTKCRQRKAANRYKGIQTATCPKCGNVKLPHCACKSCGFYKDKQVTSIES